MNNVHMIVAMDIKHGIGKNGKLLYHIPLDMQHFKDTTSGQVVVMGRRNYESLPEKFRPLPRRENIVLTRNRSFAAPGCQIMFSVDEVLNFAEGNPNREIWIIGGAEIYEQFFPHATRILITHIEASSDADTFFPPRPKEWTLRRKIDEKLVSANNPIAFWIGEYRKGLA